MRHSNDRLGLVMLVILIKKLAAMYLFLYPLN